MKGKARWFETWAEHLEEYERSRLDYRALFSRDSNGVVRLLQWIDRVGGLAAYKIRRKSHREFLEGTRSVPDLSKLESGLRVKYEDFYYNGGYFWEPRKPDKESM